MGVASGMSSQLSGKVGNIVFRQTKDGKTVVYEKRKKKSVPVRTEKQMRVRMQWSNLGAIYTQFHKTLKKGFEGIGSKMSDYNAFMQSNIGVCSVYLPKKMNLNGGCVLAPYQITRGKLPSIDYKVNGNNVLVTDVALGSLVITAETSVGEFSEAVIANNDNYKEGDQLTFFYGKQSVDAVTEVPRARIYGCKVVLDTNDASMLWDVVAGLGFSSVNGFLGMGMPVQECAAAWIHSREELNSGDITVSTQYFWVDSSVLESFQDNDAFKATADSYGGVNTEDAFLDPSSDSWLMGHGFWFMNGGAGGDGGASGGSEAGGSGSEAGGSGSEAGGADDGGASGGDGDGDGDGGSEVD